MNAETRPRPYLEWPGNDYLAAADLREGLPRLGAAKEFIQWVAATPASTPALRVLYTCRHAWLTELVDRLRIGEEYRKPAAEAAAAILVPAQRLCEERKAQARATLTGAAFGDYMRQMQRWYEQECQQAQRLYVDMLADQIEVQFVLSALWRVSIKK